MNQDRNRHEATDIDPQVSLHYESLADEKTPPELDRAIMREAKRAVQADNRRGDFGAWFRPIAITATVGLSLAFILDLSETSIFSPPTDMSRETGQPDSIESATESAPDNAARTRTATVAADDLRREKFVPKQPSKMTAPDVAAPGTRQQEAAFADSAAVRDSLSNEIGNAEKRLQKTGATAGATLQTATAAPAPAVRLSTNLCTGAQKSDVGEWWKCIEELHQLGYSGTADLELNSLREEFPEFEPPE